MTDEEAIKLLTRLINKSIDGYEVQALNMAIKALQALCTNGCEYCEYTECPLAQEESEEEE